MSYLLNDPPLLLFSFCQQNQNVILKKCGYVTSCHQSLKVRPSLLAPPHPFFTHYFFRGRNMNTNWSSVKVSFPHSLLVWSFLNTIFLSPITLSHATLVSECLLILVHLPPNLRFLSGPCAVESRGEIPSSL